MGGRSLVRTVVAVAMASAMALACGDAFAASDLALLAPGRPRPDRPHRAVTWAACTSSAGWI